MTTAFRTQGTDYPDFVPRGLPTINVQCNQSMSPSVRHSYQPSQHNPFKNANMGFGDFSSQMMNVAA